jgi:ribosomal protein S4
LKKALLVKTERDYLKNQIGVARDSIVILSNIVNNQDSIIVKQDSTISLYKKNEVEYTQIIKNKDSEIEIKDKQIKKAKNKSRIAWITTGLSTIAFVIILL